MWKITIVILIIIIIIYKNTIMLLTVFCYQVLIVIL